MSDDRDKRPSPDDDAELEREIRSRRKYSLAEAIGRTAGDLLKGASPVTHKRQAELEIGQCLEARLADAEGALRIVLQRRVLESEALLAAGYERPLAALARITRRLLGSEPRLRRFVRQVDAEWGRLYSRRPYFDPETGRAEAGDPYTIESVRAALGKLDAALAGEREIGETHGAG